MRAPHASTVWNGIDLHWAYADLLGSIRRRTQCLHRAQDVLHDALLRFALVPARERIDEPRAYLRTVVRTVLADHHARESRWAVRDEAQLSAEAAAEIVPSPERLLDLRQRLDAAQALIEALPPRCREVFRLFRIEGLPQREIAARLGVSLNMVERHVMRALVELRTAREALLG